MSGVIAMSPASMVSIMHDPLVIVVYRLQPPASDFQGEKWNEIANQLSCHLEIIQYT